MAVQTDASMLAVRARLALTALALRGAGARALARSRAEPASQRPAGPAASFSALLQARLEPPDLPPLGSGAPAPPAPPFDPANAEARDERAAAGPERYVVRPGDTLWRLAVHRFGVHVEDLARDNGIADPSRISPGQVLVVRRHGDTSARRVVASWYGPGFDWRPMANGDPYDRHAATIAHKTLPLGSRVVLTNPRTGTTVHATVTDRGPYVEGREVDLSYGLAKQLGLVEAGVGELLLRVGG